MTCRRCRTHREQTYHWCTHLVYDGNVYHGPCQCGCESRPRRKKKT